MRLIDADYFKMQIAVATLKSNIEPEKGIALMELVDAQPTAFDVCKAIKRLESKMYDARTKDDYEEGVNDMIKIAVHIVKTEAGNDKE